MLKISLPIRIHTWGGLGSQLFAIELAQFLADKYPNRKLKIFLHTGGVTRRDPEIATLFPEFRYVFVDDFSNKVSHSDAQKFNMRGGLLNDVRRALKNAVKILGLVADCNDDKSQRGVRPWVLSIRGHYSYRTINPDFLKLLSDLIKQKENIAFSRPSRYCAVHYRLGDLLILAEKNPISEESLREEVSRVLSSQKFDSLVVLSDSPVEAKIRLSGLSDIEILSPQIETIDVIATSLRARYFIGTSSKISFWIAAIRSCSLSLDSSLPMNNEEQYRGLIQSNGATVHKFESQPKP